MNDSLNTNTNVIDIAISNLEKSSEVISSWADNPKNYNTELAHMLGMISLEMRACASNLREAHYMYGLN
jgi:hypothetical protein